MRNKLISTRLPLFLFIVLLGFQSSFAEEITAKITQSGDEISLELSWVDTGLSFKKTIQGGSVFFTFNKPITLDGQIKIRKDARPWIIAIAPGYDTLLIKLKHDTIFDLADIEQGIRLTIKPPPHPLAVKKKHNKQFKLLRARVLAKQRRTHEALDLLDELNRETPEDISVLITLSEVTYETGKRREAIDLIHTAESLDPTNPIIRQIKERFLLSTQPFTRIESARKDTNRSLSENFYRVQIETKPFRWLAMGIKYATRDILHNSTGSSTTIEDEVSQLELYYHIENMDVFLTSMSLFVNENAYVGLYRDFIWNGDSYSLMVGMDINRPNWDFFTSQVEEGRKHRFSFKYYQLVNSLVHFTLYTSLNQYILEANSTQPVSTILQGNVTYQLPGNLSISEWMGENSFINLGYDFDTETILDKDNMSAEIEAVYTRKTHGPRLYFGKAYKSWDFQGYIGYFFRSYAANGDFIGTHLSYGKETHKSISLNLDRYIDKNANTVSLITLGFNWVF